MEPLDPPPSPSLGRSNLHAEKEGDETPVGSAFRDGEQDEDGREQRPNKHLDASPEQQNISNIPRAHASASEGECTSSSARVTSSVMAS